MNNTETNEDLIKSLQKQIKHLEHYRDTSEGLWCFDRNPNEVSYEWIKENSFQLFEHYIIRNEQI